MLIELRQEYNCIQVIYININVCNAITKAAQICVTDTLERYTLRETNSHEFNLVTDIAIQFAEDSFAFHRRYKSIWYNATFKAELFTSVIKQEICSA